jgi:transcriptional regulator with XRE-family HTH domain
MPNLYLSKEERAEQIRLVAARMTLDAAGEIVDPAALLTWVMTEFDLAQVSARVLINKALRAVRVAATPPAVLAVVQAVAYGEQLVAAGKLRKAPAMPTVRRAAKLGEIVGADDRTGRWLLPRTEVETWLLKNYGASPPALPNPVKDAGRSRRRPKQEALINYLRAEMTTRDWNQAALAAHCGVTRAQISRLIRNDGGGMDANLVRAIADGLGVSQIKLFAIAGLITEDLETYQALLQNTELRSFLHNYHQLSPTAQRDFLKICDVMFAACLAPEELPAKIAASRGSATLKPPVQGLPHAKT